MFKDREEIESAVVLAVKRNALQVLIPKYGLEGPLYLPSDKFMYNEEVSVNLLIEYGKHLITIKIQCYMLLIIIWTILIGL